MKKITFFLLFLIITSYSFGQRHREVVKFEAKTVSGGLVFGVAYTENEADIILDDFQQRNEGSKYDIAESRRLYKHTTLQIKDRTEDPVKTFRYLCDKTYKVLSAEDVKALELIEKKGFRTAVSYYMDARQAEEKFVVNRFSDLTANFSKFRY